MAMTFIKSGEWILKDQDSVIRTDLGSCVSLCLWDPVRRLGGMNHYLLPGNAADPDGSPLKGHHANQTLIEEMLKNGASVRNLQGAILGGGRLGIENDIFCIGESNVLAAESVLDQYGIPVIIRRTGGNLSRNVELDVDTGLITIREIEMDTGAMQQYQYRFDKR